MSNTPATASDTTDTTGYDDTGHYDALNWLVGTWLPAWLDLSPAFHALAASVRGLDRIVDQASAERAGPVVVRARSTTEATQRCDDVSTVDAAWAPAQVAAWAALSAVRGAPWDYDLDAARHAASQAAWAAPDLARDAWDAASAAALYAARAAVRGVPVDAAEQAARAALWPPVAALRLSVAELHQRVAQAGCTW